MYIKIYAYVYMGASSVQETKADKNYKKGKVQFGKTS